MWRLWLPKWMTPNKQVLSWAIFEFGYWGAVALTAQTFIPYLLKRTMGEMAAQSPILWGWVVAGATLFGIFSCPFFGAIADWTETRKLQIFIFSAIAVSASVLFVVTYDSWFVASILAGCCLLPYVIAMTLFNSLLVFLAKDESELAAASTLATTLGCLGPAVLLTLLDAPSFHESQLSREYLLSLFLLAGAWWGVFSIPLFRFVPEFKAHEVPTLKDQVTEAHDLIQKTAKNKNLICLLLGLFVFGDITSAMFHLSFIFGASIGIDTHNLFAAFLFNRWVSVFMSFIWGFVANFIAPKIGFLLVMGCMFLSTITAYVMVSAAEFWLLQILLAVVSTGSFIFCRVLLASVTPVDKAGFHFGFLGAVGNLSGFFGPMMYAIVGTLTGDPKDGFLFLGMLTFLAVYLISVVDFDLAKLAAQSEPIPDDPNE